MSWGLARVLLDGMANTLVLTLAGAVLGFVLAFVFGLARLARRKAVRAIGLAYTETFRGMSPLILLFWLIYVVPELGFQLEPLWAGTLALGLNIGAYGAEVVRSGILAVPAAQLEAATALSFSRTQTMTRVILPQAIVRMIPTFANNLIELLKATSLVSIVYITDFTYAGQLVRTSTGETAMVYTILLAGYAVIAIAFIAVMRQAEHAALRRLGRDVPRGLFQRARAEGVG